MIKLFSSIVLAAFITGCQTIRNFSDRNTDDGTTCQESFDQIQKKTDIGSLNLIRQIYYRGCYNETIKAVQIAREKFRDSVTSVTRDTLEVVSYEGSFIDYTMESYERTYLTLLAARSYIKLNKTEDAKVELRKAYEESISQIETTGQDRITLFMMAVLWERLNDRAMAQPLYKKIIELSNMNDDPLFYYAKKRYEHAGSNVLPHPLIYELGSMPDLNLSYNYDVDFRYPLYDQIDYEGKHHDNYTRNMISPCKSDSTSVVPTYDWLKFLTNRIYYSDNPKYKIKKIARVPLAILTSATVLVGGTYLTTLAVKTGDGRAVISSVALTVVGTGYAFTRAMAPDLRYWNELPQAILISELEIDPRFDSCLKEFKHEKWLDPKRFL